MAVGRQERERAGGACWVLCRPPLPLPPCSHPGGPGSGESPPSLRCAWSPRPHRWLPSTLLDRCLATCPSPAESPRPSRTHSMSLLVSFAPGGHGSAGTCRHLQSSRGEAARGGWARCWAPLPSSFQTPSGPALPSSGGQLLLLPSLWAGAQWKLSG